MTELPIHHILPDIKNRLGAGRRLVLQAPPGAGKTTAVPLALLDAPWLAGKTILMLEPRRLAARAAAARMAQLLDEAVGETVGYRVRFEHKVSARTRIEVVTEGILTRRLQSDPELAGVGLVIFDEFHERHLHSDLGLALCLDAGEALREDLALLVMSATLDGAAIAKLLDAPVLTSEGRAYPVDVRYLNSEPEGRPADIAAAAVRRALGETEGDVLVFLPGSGEIRRVAELLADAPVQLHPLYGDLPLEAQQRALVPDAQGRRKVVLATNIAETSLTIEGVRVVVDSGWARVPRFDPRSGLTRLELVRVPRASADQRAGRAGRLGPGVCYRLWGEGTQRGLIPFALPEIGSADLAPLALDLAQWGVRDAAALRWLDTPPAGALAQANALLTELEALDGEGRITALGREMANLPLHPRLSHMLLRAKPLGLAGLACDVAALLSERDILRGPPHERSCDFAVRLEALQAHRRDGRDGARRLDADPNACAGAERSSRQWRHLVDATAPDATHIAECGLLLSLAYPDRVARQRGEGGRYLLANGRGGKLETHCPLARQPYIVAAELDGAGDDSRIRSAAPITLAELEQVHAARLQWREEVRWDAATEAVVARRVRGLGALELESAPLDKAAPERMTAALLDGIRQMGLTVLPWDDETRQLQARVESLRQWSPEEGWPDLSDAALLATPEQWLAPYLNGMSRRSHLSRLELKSILRDSLGWERAQRLDSEAPTHLKVPSGSHKRLHYEPGQPPVLAVKLQELFGLADTPRVAHGKVAVMLHLLSPAQRPIQVTQDLKGFWERTYAEVRKELKGRYPKHPWPDDPWTATPTARAKPRQP
ncbi:MAG: ATP-dependent helicase HrpB [Gammaproteobacteria bacterium HGW-Gammaproteobacteria-1]|jgi:ATP-dependent helicase HrpB|nr:MAG: ATP-dependent helicase HrpB [Gammaproteobacteria bacterium HGW-Gammaproteobacteria-1]